MSQTEKQQHSYEWDKHIKALEDFKKENGHCNVPTDDSMLGKWVVYVRTLATLDPEESRKREGVFLTEEQKLRLDRLGFVWTHQSRSGQTERVWEEDADDFEDEAETKTEAEVNVLKQHGGNLKRAIYVDTKKPVESSQRPASENNLEKIRLNESRGQKTASVATKSSVGGTPSSFSDSNYGNNKDWNECFRMLKCFREENGHTQVPYRRSPHNHPMAVLCKFVQQMREHKVMKNQGQKSLLTDERERMLESIDFEWTTSFECTKEGAKLAQAKAAKSSSNVDTKTVARAKKKDPKTNSTPGKRTVIVDCEGTRWTAYKPLSIEKLLNPAKAPPQRIPDCPPTPENWGIELAYESDGSVDSLTF